jgi:hypothetical protein
MQEVGRTSFRTRSGKIWIWKTIEYEVQQAFTTEDGNRVFFLMLSLICLMAKKMIVDSKSSLTAYEIH